MGGVRPRPGAYWKPLGSEPLLEIQAEGRLHSWTLATALGREQWEKQVWESRPQVSQAGQREGASGGTWDPSRADGAAQGCSRKAEEPGLQVPWEPQSFYAWEVRSQQQEGW